MVLVDEAVAVDLGKRSLGASGAGVVYVDRAVREPGDVVVGPRTFSLTRPALMVFRDEMPGANWMQVEGEASSLRSPRIWSYS